MGLKLFHDKARRDTAGSCVKHGQVKTDSRRKFEVASIKTNLSGQPLAPGNPLAFSPGGRFTATNVTLVDVIVRVYPTRRIQMQGGPAWIDFDRFDIVAKADESDGEITAEDRPAMVQTLLEDRFKLKFHTEKKEMSVLALVVGKDGYRLPPPKEATTGNALDSTSSLSGDHGQMIFRNMAIQGLVNTMSNMLRTVIIDGTGIEGRYDFTLDPVRFTERGDSRPQAVVTAVQEQLGLKLEKRRTTLDITIIDRAERPTDN